MVNGQTNFNANVLMAANLALAGNLDLNGGTLANSGGTLTGMVHPLLHQVRITIFILIAKATSHSALQVNYFQAEFLMATMAALVV